MAQRSSRRSPGVGMSALLALAIGVTFYGLMSVASRKLPRAKQIGLEYGIWQYLLGGVIVTAIIGGLYFLALRIPICLAVAAVAITALMVLAPPKQDAFFSICVAMLIIPLAAPVIRLVPLMFSRLFSSTPLNALPSNSREYRERTGQSLNGTNGQPLWRP